MNDARTPQAGPSGSSEPPLDDEALGALVREVAESWTMPPQRIGQRTWRDIATARRTDAHGVRWARRLGGAFVAAAAATLVLALGAVWLTQPRSGPATGTGTPGASASGGLAPSERPSQTPTGPSQTPYPTLVVNGPALPAIAFPVAAQGYSLLDLSAGRLGPALEGTTFGGRLLPRAGGGSLCLCFHEDQFTDSVPTAVSVHLIEYDAAGDQIGTRPVASYGGGILDPASTAPPVLVTVSAAADLGHAYVGWAIRGVGWRSGVDVVDLATGAVVQTVRLPDLAVTDPFGSSMGTEAPRVIVSPSGRRLVIIQTHGVQTPQVLLQDGPDHWSATIEAGRVGPLMAFAPGAGTLDPAACPWPFDERFASDDVFAAICPSQGELRRVDLAGRALGAIAFDGSRGLPLVTSVDGPGGVRFVWLPFARSLTKIDVVTGRVAGTLELPAPTASLGQGSDPLGALAGAFGRWLAPTAEAKLFLQPALALSPDGSRLYLLGVNGTGIEDPNARSAGIGVVDTASLRLVGTWAPTADLTSLAVSSDGRYVFAAGAPGVDAVGRQTDWPASVTVYRSADGTVAAIAGRLGDQFITFDPALVP